MFSLVPWRKAEGNNGGALARRDDPFALLRREFDARTKGGVESTWLSRRLLERLSVPDTPAAIRMRDAASATVL